MSDTIKVVELDEIRKAIRAHAPLMSRGMLDKITKSLNARKRTFRRFEAPHPVPVAGVYYLEIVRKIHSNIQNSKQ